MPERYILAYTFSTFAVGLACMGVTLVLARHKSDTLARAYLVFYTVLSYLVMVALLLAYADTLDNGGDSPVRPVLEYLEAIIGRYAIMFALPFFVHRVFAVKDTMRDWLLLALTVLAAAGQHCTEYLLGSVWDERGDVAEDVLFAAVFAYTLWIGFSRRNVAGVYRPFAFRLLVLLGAGLPGITHDLFLSDFTHIRLYPLWYCVLSVALTHCLIRRRLAPSRAAIPAQWGLSSRETEVVMLVQRGLSNNEVARTLHISINTVKTHLRAVFEKSGARSRFDLISRLASSESRVDDQDD